MIFFYKNKKDLPLENYGYLPLVPMIKTLDSESVLEVLKPVQDPELQKSLVALNMIRNVKVDGGNVGFTLVLTTPACPLREVI